MIWRPALVATFLSFHLCGTAAAVVPASKAGGPGSKAPAAAEPGPRILGLTSLDGLSREERSAAYTEYVLAFRSASAAGNEARARELAEKATHLWPERCRPW